MGGRLFHKGPTCGASFLRGTKVSQSLGCSFYSGRKLVEDENSSVQSHVYNASLARLILARCNTSIYCQGYTRTTYT